KTSILDLQALKVAFIGHYSRKKETKTQIHTELLVLKTQATNLNSEEMKRNLVTTSEDHQNLLSVELWESYSISDQDVTKDAFTCYIKEPIAHKNHDPLMWWEN
ncbi:9864_t:CDS:1, partial [Cetraspora pellucida]